MAERVTKSLISAVPAKVGWLALLAPVASEPPLPLETTPPVTATSRSSTETTPDAEVVTFSLLVMMTLSG